MALNLLDLGIRPLDRIVVQLPNTAMFCYLPPATTSTGPRSLTRIAVPFPVGQFSILEHTS